MDGDYDDPESDVSECYSTREAGQGGRTMKPYRLTDEQVKRIQEASKPGKRRGPDCR